METPGLVPLPSLLLCLTLFFSSFPGPLLCLLFPESLQIPLPSGLAQLSVLSPSVYVRDLVPWGFGPIPGCPLGTSRKKSRNMWLCQVWCKWAHPWALGLAKEITSQAPCTWCPEPRGLPLGAQGPQGKETGKSHREPPMLLRDSRHGPQPPSQAASGSATNLPSQETCHPPTGQTVIPKSLLLLQTPGKTWSSHGSPPSWRLPLLLIFSQGAETALSFFQHCSLPSFLALLHISLL